MGADELVEDPRLHRLGDAAAVVPNLDSPVAAFLVPGGDPHPARAPRLAILDGVAEEVDEHELGAGGVDLDVGDGLSDLDLDLAFEGQGLEPEDRLLDQLAERQPP